MLSPEAGMHTKVQLAQTKGGPACFPELRGIAVLVHLAAPVIIHLQVGAPSRSVTEVTVTDQ